MTTRKFQQNSYVWFLFRGWDAWVGRCLVKLFSSDMQNLLQINKQKFQFSKWKMWIQMNLGEWSCYVATFFRWSAFTAYNSDAKNKYQTEYVCFDFDLNKHNSWFPGTGRAIVDLQSLLGYTWFQVYTIDNFDCIIQIFVSVNVQMEASSFLHSIFHLINRLLVYDNHLKLASIHRNMKWKTLCICFCNEGIFNFYLISHLVFK